jgi:3-isopropylmalate/(R)-2-methylmalate dehydratase large subunit
VSPLVAAATAVTGTLAAPTDLPPVEVAVPENV